MAAPRCASPGNAKQAPATAAWSEAGAVDQAILAGRLTISVEDVGERTDVPNAATAAQTKMRMTKASIVATTSSITARRLSR